MPDDNFCSNPECPFHYPASGNTQTAIINGAPVTVNRFVIKETDTYLCGTCMKVYEIFYRTMKEKLCSNTNV